MACCFLAPAIILEALFQKQRADADNRRFVVDSVGIGLLDLLSFLCVLTQNGIESADGKTHMLVI